MINRALLRTKCVQVLYSAFATHAYDGREVEDELYESIRWAENLYYCVLRFPEALMRYVAAKTRQAEAEGTEPEFARLAHSPRIEHNMALNMLIINKQLCHETDEREIGWVWEMHPEALADVARSVQESKYLTAYEESATGAFAQDACFVTDILGQAFAESEAVARALEEVCVYWNDDLSNAVHFASLTIRRMQPARGAEQTLLPTVKHQEDLEYANHLLRYTLLNAEALDRRIQPLLNRWDPDRLPVIDLTILRVAVAEMLTCPDIHLGVTINEFIEIAKAYCQEASVEYMGAVLHRIGAEIKPLEAKAKADRPTEADKADSAGNAEAQDNNNDNK